VAQTSTEQLPVVLVIDDETQIRRFLRAGFELDGFTVNEAANAAEGLRSATLRPLDLMILDLALPDRDGAEVLTRLRSWSNVPVIVLSVRSDERSKTELQLTMIALELFDKLRSIADLGPICVAHAVIFMAIDVRAGASLTEEAFQKVEHTSPTLRIERLENSAHGENPFSPSSTSAHGKNRHPPSFGYASRCVRHINRACRSVA